MHISVILAHPNQDSFNHAIAREVVAELNRKRHQAAFHDLYAERFDPVLPVEEMCKEAMLPSVVEAHCREIALAQGIVIVHPNWWGQPPAILKGWIDRVIRPGVAYEFLPGDAGEGTPRGLLKATAALVFNTANTPHAREVAVFGDPLDTLWRNCVFGLCGVDTVFRETFQVVVTSTLSQRQHWLARVREVVGSYFPAEKRV